MFYPPVLFIQLMIKSYARASLILFALAINGPAVLGQKPVASGPIEQDASAEFKPTRLSPPFEPIVNAPVLSAKEVTNQVALDELVLGMALGGQARAYPLNVLTGPTREVINDNLGGQPIAAVWCPLCYNGLVYSRRVKERVLTFGVSGLLWNQSLVMYDAETNSYWSSLMGQAMQGPLKATRLEVLPSELTTWGAWRALHPDTTILNLSRIDRQFTREIYDEPALFVYGWSLGLQRYHCPLYTLAANRVLNLQLGGNALLLTYEVESTEPHLFSREVEGRVLTFEPDGESQMRDEQTNSSWNLRTGEATAGRLKGKQLERKFGMLSYRQAWLTFYPKSRSVPEKETAKP